MANSAGREFTAHGGSRFSVAPVSYSWWMTSSIVERKTLAKYATCGNASARGQVAVSTLSSVEYWRLAEMIPTGTSIIKPITDASNSRRSKDQKHLPISVRTGGVNEGVGLAEIALELIADPDRASHPERPSLSELNAALFGELWVGGRAFLPYLQHKDNPWPRESESTRRSSTRTPEGPERTARRVRWAGVPEVVSNLLPAAPLRLPLDEVLGEKERVRRPFREATHQVEVPVRAVRRRD